MLRFIYILILFIVFQIPAFAEERQIPFQQIPGQPYFGSADLSIDSADYNTLILQLKCKKSGTARIFWASSYDPQFNQPKSIWFSIKAGQHNYYFNLPSQNPNWLGWITKFLFYPEIGAQNAEIVAAKVIKGNLLTNITSGWQEFWGPKGRIVSGTTINLIASSAIFGRSINIYLYWIIVFSFLLFFTNNLIENARQDKNYLDNLKLSLIKTSKTTLLVTVFCWLFLSLNSTYNSWQRFKTSYANYFGKSIEDKRATASGKEYYDFLAFAKDKLPKQPIIFSVISSKHTPDLHARIELIPHIYKYQEIEPEYILVFYPEAKQLLDIKNYSILAKLNDSKYILKRNDQ